MTIRTHLNNITYLKNDGTFSYNEEWVWSKTHKDKSVKSEKNNDHKSITNEPDDFMVTHNGDTSEGEQTK